MDIVCRQYHEMVSHRGANEGQARVLLMFPSNSALYTLPKHSGNAGVRNSFHLKKRFRSPRQMASDLISVSWNTNKNRGEQKGGTEIDFQGFAHSLTKSNKRERRAKSKRNRNVWGGLEKRAARVRVTPRMLAAEKWEKSLINKEKMNKNETKRNKIK